MPQHRKRVTLRDVAEAAGVSLKTASNVVNGNGRMTDATRDKVQHVIAELGYRVNVSARNLNRGITGSIILAVPMLSAPYLANLASAVIEAARSREYSVFVTTYAEGSATGARALLRSFNSTVSDGVILSMSEMERLEPDDLRVDFPLVTVGSRTAWDLVDRVTTDEIGDAARAAGYLIDRGSARLAVIGAHRPYDHDALADAADGNAELRLRGIIEECERRGLLLDPRLVGVTGHDWTIGNGQATMQRLIDTGIAFDGVVCLNDQLAIGALTALHLAGRDVPGDVQVIGFDNNEESRYLLPPLTTVDSSLDWIASTAVDRMLARIAANTRGNTRGNGGEAIPPETLRTQSRIIERATTR